MSTRLSGYLRKKLKSISLKAPSSSNEVSQTVQVAKTKASAKASPKNAVHNDLFQIAEAMLKNGYVKNATECIALVPQNRRTNKHYQLLASSLLAYGDYLGSETALENINESKLSSNGRRIFLQTRAELETAKGNFEVAIRYYQMLQCLFRERALHYSIQVVKLSQSSGDRQAFESYLTNLMNEHPNHPTVVEIHCAHLYETNQLDRLRHSLGYYLPRLVNSSKLFVLEATCAWIEQDLPRFDHTMRLIRLNEIYTRIVAEQLQRWRVHQPSAEETVQAMIASCKRKLSMETGSALINHAWTLHSLGEDDSAIEAMNGYIDAEGNLLQAYLLRGLAHQAKRNFAQSKTDLDLVVTQSPKQNLAYRALLQNSFQNHPDMAPTRELIAYRNRHNPQFTRTGPDGRTGFYDVEGGQALWFEGKYLDGYRAKLNKSTCRYLESSFPKQYCSFSSFSLRPGDQRILILADDGISDEIRWASFYQKLPTDRDFLVTCEPRLLSLMRRSFPHLSFVPVARRWPDLPCPRMPDRMRTDNVDFARIITDGLFEQIGNFDRLMFQQDLVAAHWEGLPKKAPSQLGAGRGSFLLPEPAAVAHWREKLLRRSSRSKSRLKVGLNWRSGLVNSRRQLQYLSLEDLQELLQIDDIDFYALQHGMNEEELARCVDSGVKLLEEVDWKDDFETVAAICANMDLVIGISSSSFEVAAAVGTECWLAGISPEAVGLRLGDSPNDLDRISWNTRVIRPISGVADAQHEVWPRQEVLDILKTDLARKARELADTTSARAQKDEKICQQASASPF